MSLGSSPPRQSEVASTFEDLGIGLTRPPDLHQSTGRRHGSDASAIVRTKGLLVGTTGRGERVLELARVEIVAYEERVRLGTERGIVGLLDRTEEKLALERDVACHVGAEAQRPRSLDASRHAGDDVVEQLAGSLERATLGTAGRLEQDALASGRKVALRGCVACLGEELRRHGRQSPASRDGSGLRELGGDDRRRADHALR